MATYNLSERVARVRCKHCGLTIEYYKGIWWTGDDFMCPDGETQHEPKKPE